MTTRMPRGAIPTPRSEFAASEPYRGPGLARKSSFQGASFLGPITNLLVQPYKAGGAAPESFLAWPLEIGFWGNDKVSNSSWAEGSLCQGLRRTQGVHPDRRRPIHFTGMRVVEFCPIHANVRVSSGT